MKRGGRGRRPAVALDAGDVVSPTGERLARGPVERAEQEVRDVNGEPGRPYRALGTLDIMLRSGSINREMKRAGERFGREFARAALDPLGAADPTRLPVLVSAGLKYEPPDHSEHARALVVRALSVLGGSESTLGSCAYHVLGRGLSLRDWQIHRGGNRHQPVNFASGILVGALDLLRIHYLTLDRCRLD